MARGPNGKYVMAVDSYASMCIDIKARIIQIQIYIHKYTYIRVCIHIYIYIYISIC